MKKLMKNKKGFTLMEMLIVVAIIVILVAISIPVFTDQLNKAKYSTELANERAAKAAALAEYLTMDSPSGFTKYYNVDTGKLEATYSGDEYGNNYTYDGTTYNHEGCVISVTVTNEGVATPSWVTKP